MSRTISFSPVNFRMTEFLSARIGRHEYKSKRLDGKQEFVIDEPLIAEFAEMEAHQFDCCNPYYKDKVWGIFGEQDTLARFEPLFLEHYNRSFHFPGAHTPTAEEVKTWYVPLVEKLMMEYPASKDGYRYFGIDLDLSIHDGYNYMESINPYS